MTQSIEMILASTPVGEIGFKNKLPWCLKGDLKRFKELTMGMVVIVGKNTYESFPGPLPGRTLIVVSSSLMETSPPSNDVHFVKDFEQALITAAIFPVAKVFLAGGASLYAIGLCIADIVHHTCVYKESDGGAYDTQVPNFQLHDFDSLHEPIGVYEPNHNGILVISHAYATYARRKHD